MKKILIILFAGIFQCVYSQSNDLPLSMVPNTPPSPQAEALNRLGEYRANPTGMPDISIPLHTVDFYGYKIPLKLNYEATPIKCGYNYDVYGRGWTLSGTSCVSRELRGMPDESRGFNIDKEQLDISRDLSLNTDYFDYLRGFNFQSDLFSAVLPDGRYFNFFIRKDNSGQLVFELPDNYAKIKIECSTGITLSYFKITDEEGIVYTFDVVDYVLYEYLDLTPVNVTWLLTSIDVPNRGTIEYTYNNPVRIIYSGGSYETMLRFVGIGPYYNFSTGSISSGYEINYSDIYNGGEYRMRQIKSIYYGKTRVDFNYQSDDVHASSIKIYDNGILKRQVMFTLASSYIVLNKLTISGEDANDKLVYSFSYTSKNMGNHTDHWGYSGMSDKISDIGNFNVNVNDFAFSISSTVSSHSGTLALYPEGEEYLSGSRKFKLQSSMTTESRRPLIPERHGILSSITYPNGGRTDFYFENHKYVTASLENGDFELDRRKQRIAEGGGMRIKRIVNYDADGNMVNQDTYKYGYTYDEIQNNNFPFPARGSHPLTSHTGCGEPVVDPNVLTYLNYDHSSRIPRGLLEMMTGIGSGGERGTFDYLTFSELNANYPWMWEWRFSAYNFRNLLGQRPAVVYPLITIYHGTADDDYRFSEAVGKTEYRYDIYDYGSVDNYLYQFRKQIYVDTTYIEPLLKVVNSLVPEYHGSKRNALVEKSEYVAEKSGTVTSYRMIEKETYSHEYSEKTVQTGYIYNNMYNRGISATHNFLFSTGRREFHFNELYSSIAEYIGTSHLVSKTTTKIRKQENGYGNCSLTENYTYQYGDHLKTKEYWDNGNRVDSTTYIQDSDVNVTLASMRDKNMYAYPLLSTTSVDFFGKKTIKGQKLEYGKYVIDNKDYYLPSKAYELYNNIYEQKYEVVAYSSHGNPLEVVDASGIHTVYLWGYDDRYLIAEIRNSSQMEVKNAVDQIPGGIAGYGIHITSLDKLRTLLPDAQIKTWTHRPLFGVSAYSDESGRTVYYDYDGLGRLKSEYYYEANIISESNKRYINRYEYEFKNQ